MWTEISTSSESHRDQQIHEYCLASNWVGKAASHLFMNFVSFNRLTGEYDFTEMPVCWNFYNTAFLESSHRFHPCFWIVLIVYYLPALFAVRQVIHLAIVVHERMIVLLWIKGKSAFSLRAADKHTIPCSSKSFGVCFDVFHEGAVHPFGLFPVNVVKTSIDLVRISRCWTSLRAPTISCVYPCKPLTQISSCYNGHPQPATSTPSSSLMKKLTLRNDPTHISWPASLTFANCFGNVSIVWAGQNQVALILNLSQSFRRRSTPTVAPNIPRETSVGLAGEPSLVLILANSVLCYARGL